MKNQTLAVAVLLCIVFALAAPLVAQQSAPANKPPLYTYIAEWTVPRAQWADMEKNGESERPLLDKLVADGTLLGYGEYLTIIHQEGEPTHGSWFSAASEGNLMKALEAIYAQPALVTSPAQGASKHWDAILTSTIYNGKSGKSSGYLAVSKWQVKPGQMRAYSELMKHTINPVFDKLVADGTITSYGTDMEDYHSAPIGTIWEYFTVPDAASLDKANKAIDDLFNGDPAIGSAYRSVFETEGHRDYLYRLKYMVNK